MTIQRLAAGNFHVVSDIPIFTPDQLKNKFLLKGPNNFKLLMDYESGDVYSTDCIWCEPRIEFRVPDEINRLFDGLHGVSLLDMTHSGRLEQITSYIDSHRGDLRRVTEKDMNPRASVLSTQVALYNDKSFPLTPAGMNTLPIGTFVSMAQGSQSVHHRIIDRNVINGKVVYDLDTPRELGPIETLYGIATNQAFSMAVFADDLSPTIQEGMVVAVWKTDMWSHADVAFSLLITGAAMNTFRNPNINHGMLGNLFGAIPMVAVRLGERSWVYWWDAILNKMGYLPNQAVRNVVNLPGGAGARGTVRRIGEMEFGIARYDIPLKLGLPLMSATMTVLWNSPELLKRGYSWATGDRSTMLTTGRGGADVDDFLRQGGKLARDAVYTVANEVKDGVMNTAEATVDLAETLLHGAGRTVGAAVGGIFGGAMPEGTAPAFRDAISSGTKTIVIVAGGLLIFSVWRKVG